MDRLLGVYQELAEQGVSLFTWDIGEEKAATLEMGGRYAVFMDFDNITASIVNNYVRMKIMPPPVKKKYGRVHLAYLLMICTLKRSLPIAAIQRLIPEEELDAAVGSGLTEAWELAEHFQVTEPFLRRAVAYYRSQKMI